MTVRRSSPSRNSRTVTPEVVPRISASRVSQASVPSGSTLIRLNTCPSIGENWAVATTAPPVRTDAESAYSVALLRDVDRGRGGAGVVDHAGGDPSGGVEPRCR